MRFIVLFLIFTQAALASIPGSDLEVRHQELIMKAIDNKCGSMFNLKQIKSTAKEIRIDQGIIDFEFITVIEGTLKIDQGFFVDYLVTVKSYYSSSYDHEAQDYGVYSIDDLSCDLKE
jgi:hypothetical protein